MAQVALRWLLQKDFVPSVIIGAKNLKQLEDNMGAGAGWELTKKQVQQKLCYQCWLLTFTVKSL